MKLIIDIHKEQYDFIKQGMPIDKVVQFPALMEAVCEHIAQGTPLPKGHGDLKDMDDIYEALEGWDDDTGWIVDAIDCQAPTIVEADKGESEGEE